MYLGGDPYGNIGGKLYGNLFRILCEYLCSCVELHPAAFWPIFQSFIFHIVSYTILCCNFPVLHFLGISRYYYISFHIFPHCDHLVSSVNITQHLLNSRQDKTHSSKVRLSFESLHSGLFVFFHVQCFHLFLWCTNNTRYNCGFSTNHWLCWVKLVMEYMFFAMPWSG